MRHCVMSILPIIFLATFINTQIYAAPNNYYVVKRGFRPSLLDWRLHVSPYFDTAKRLTGPLMVEQPQLQRSEVPKSRMNRDLDTVLQENMDLAEEILFDLKSLLKNDGRPGRSTRMLQDMVEIDPDDPKRLLRIS